MPATARQVQVTEEQQASAAAGPKNGAAYSAIEVPGDYIAKLLDVQDYDKRADGKSFGWVWVFDILGCEFKEYTSLDAKARWKLIQVLEAMGADVTEGVNNIDPNVFIGNETAAHVDWQKNPDTLGTDEANYREIKYLFPIPADEVPAVL